MGSVLPFRQLTILTTFSGDSTLQNLLRTTALLGVLAGLTLSPALSLAGETVVGGDPVFVPDEEGPVFVPDIEGIAGVSEEGTDGDGDPDGEIADYDPAEPTNEVLFDFNEAIAFCGAIGSDEYVIDCLSERLAVIAAALPETGEFAEMRATIAQASQDLGALAAQNPSDTLPTGIARSTGSVAITTTRPLRPVDTATLSASLQAAEAIVAEAQVVLLRSSSNSQNRSLDYQQVAAVVGTSRALLRSA